MSAGAHHARLLAYEAWADRAVLAGLGAAPGAPNDVGDAGARALGLLAHVLAAQELWLARIEASGQKVEVWPSWEAARCRQTSDALAQRWSALLGSLDGSLDERGLARSVDYRNSKGEAHQSRIDDILTHVALHGAYHRGQIAALLRAAGVDPVYTDFVHATRSGLVR